MSTPSGWNSSFFSCDDVTNNFDVESIANISNSFPSTQDPVLWSHNIDHDAHIFNFDDSCNSGTLAGPSNAPAIPTFCNSSIPTDGQSWTKLPGPVPADKRGHKITEKQRRKEMKALFSALRSLLPNENIRGKRAVSEQVLEAVNYVRHLQRKVQDLSAQREKMRDNYDANAKVATKEFVDKILPFGGLEREYPALQIYSVSSGIQICMNSLEHEILYSDILLALEGEGLEVVSAASSTLNNKVYHTIHTKVFDLNTFNVRTLYHKLRQLIRTNWTQNQDLQTAEA